eukprot:13488407-Alexandrium_andersonii.AAC.1
MSPTWAAASTRPTPRASPSSTRPSGAPSTTRTTASSTVGWPASGRTSCSLPTAMRACRCGPRVAANGAALSRLPPRRSWTATPRSGT